MLKGRGVWQAAIVAFTVAIVPGAHAQEWKPEKPVEIIATNAPGGGSDRIGRTMIKIMQDRKLVPTAINLVNKPGGGSAIAYNYLNTHPKDGHYLVMGSRSLITNNIAGSGPSYTELTPAV